MIAVARRRRVQCTMMTQCVVRRSIIQIRFACRSRLYIRSTRVRIQTRMQRRQLVSVSLFGRRLVELVTWRTLICHAACSRNWQQFATSYVGDGCGWRIVTVQTRSTVESTPLIIRRNETAPLRDTRWRLILLPYWRQQWATTKNVKTRTPCRRLLLLRGAGGL